MDFRSHDALSPMYYPLRLTYGLVPFLAGLDKFFGILADWEAYLPSFAADVLPVSPAAFMMMVGVIEMIAGLAVLTKFTRLGAYIVMAWLILIAVVVTIGGHFDIAVRDLAMAVGAYTLGQLAALRGEQWLPSVHAGKGVRTHATAG